MVGQYLDDGVQLRWLAPTDLYMEFGAEWLRGDRYPSAGAAKSGFGSHSLFAKVGGDVGTDSSWLAGISYLKVRLWSVRLATKTIRCCLPVTRI